MICRPLALALLLSGADAGAQGITPGAARDGQAAEPPPAVAAALRQLESRFPAERSAGLAAIVAAGAQAVPFVVARLRVVTEHAPRSHEHGRPLFERPAIDADEFFLGLGEVHATWSAPGDDVFAGALGRDDWATHWREVALQQGWRAGPATALTHALASLGAAAGPAAPLLTELLAVDDLAVHAGVALRRIGRPAVPPLLAAMEGGVQRFAAARVLALIGRDDPAAGVLPAVTRVLRAGPPAAREPGLTVLAMLGRQNGKEQIDVAALRLREGVASNWRFAGWALGSMGAPAVPKIYSMLREEIGRPRDAALLAAVRLLGSAANDLVPEVLDVADRGMDGVIVALTLSMVGPGSKHEAEAVELLTEQLELGGMTERLGAAYALARYEGAGRFLVARMVDWLGSDDYLRQRIAVDVVGSLGGDASTCARELIAIVDADTEHLDPMGLAVVEQHVGLLTLDSGHSFLGIDGHDQALRERALLALARTGPPGQAMPVLLERLADERLGRAAARACGAAGPAAIAPLVDRLGGAGGRNAARALLAIPDGGVDALLAAVGDGSAGDAAEMALAQEGEAHVGRILAMLQDATAARRAAALRILAGMPRKELAAAQRDELFAAIGELTPEVVPVIATVDDPRALPRLLAAARHDDEVVRVQAIMALGGHLDAGGAQVLAAMRSGLVDDAAAVQGAAVAALAGRSLDDQEAAARLVQLAASSRTALRCQAIVALGSFPHQFELAAPVLRSAAGSAEHAERAAALTAIVNLGPSARSLYDALLPAVRDEEVDVRVAAVEAIAGMRPDLAVATARLAKIVADTEELPRLVGAGGRFSSSTRTWGDAVVAQVDAGLVSAEPDEVLEALRRLRENAREDAARDRVPRVETLLGFPDTGVRQAVVSTLWRLDQERAYVVLKPLLGDPDPGVRRRVVEAMASAADRAAAFALCAPLAADRDPMVRAETLTTMRRLAKDPLDATLCGATEAAARAALLDEALVVRRVAAEQLAALPTLSEGTVDALVPRLDDVAAVAEAAAVALRRAGASGGRAVRRLLELAGDRSARGDLRRAALTTAAMLRPGDAATLVTAIELLQDEDMAEGVDYVWRAHLLPR